MTTCLYCAHHNRDAATFCANCGAALHAPLQALTNGSSLKNSEYTVQSMLGQGGFGITYVALQTTLGRTVVIKELCPQDAGRAGKTLRPPAAMHGNWAQNVAGFVQEAQTLARFNHPGIVRVQDVFQENNTAYFVMEHLQGQTLGQAIKKKPFTETQVQHLLEAITDALRVVHEANMLHRDIKPDNIFLEQSGRVILLDFGSARGFQTGQTVAASRIVTLGYSPLEQYAGKARFGPFTDIYALGGTLFTALTGLEPPDAAERSVSDLRAKLEFPTGVSDKWRELIERAMSVRVDDRPQSIDELVSLNKARLSQPSTTPSSGAVKSQLQTFQVPSNNLQSNAIKKSTSFAELGQPIWSLSYSPDGASILVTSGNREVQLLDSKTQQLIHRFLGHTNRVISGAFSPDGRRVLTTSYDLTAKLWDFSSAFSLIQTFEINGNFLVASFGSNGDKVLSIDPYRHLQIWNIEYGYEKPHFTNSSYDSIVFSLTKDKIFTISPDLIGRVWSLSSGKVINTLWDFQFYSSHQIIYFMRTSPSFDFILIVDSSIPLKSVVYLYNIGYERIDQKFAGHTKPICSLAVSNDEQRILTGSEDHTARVWDIPTGRVIECLTGHTGPVTSVAFSPDGKTILTGSLDGTIRQWT